MTDGGPSLAGLDVSDPPGRWAALGFAVGDDGELVIGGVRITLGIAPPGRGIVGWSLSEGIDVEGLPARIAGPGAPSPRAPGHPNGAIAIDHVVVTTPDLDAVGTPLSRRAAVRGRRMGFRRLVGGPILELVEDRDAMASAFWGVTFAMGSADGLDALVASSRPGVVGAPRPAVQPGRRIATVSREAAGLSTRIAFIDPEPESDRPMAARRG